MASARRPLKLQILAQSQQPDAEGTRSGWIVDVHIDGERVFEKLFLIDPLSPDQRSLCRWYLEQYVQKSPYSVDLAKDAETLLKIYPEEILRQLRLKQAVTLYLQQLLSGRLLLIEVCDDSDTNSRCEETVHQLFWETLEDPVLWSNASWKIVVQRTIYPFSEHHSTLSRVPSWRRANENGSTINLLLVIARDLSRDPAIYNDVNPFLASSVLTDTQRKLRESGSPVQLHIEVVRPGTFASFQEHLRRSEEIHGPGYFHIVHFDLHGKVGTRAGKISKHGFLYFCNPESDHTVPVLARKVSEILKRHSIPFVILNACESARANCGDDANIAKVFQRQGVRNVLAMSFKVSSSAVEIFLDALYYGLLLEGSSFAASAAAARQALRVRRTRQARFGLQRKMVDSFVAVAYDSGHDSILLIPHQQTQHRPAKLMALPTISNSGDLSAPSSGILGREFDVLRLEKLLLRGDLLYLHGSAGVGKSTFLRYASSIWQSTAFADAIINIDFAKERILSAEDFASSVLRHLLHLKSEEYQSSLWTVTSLSLKSHDTDTIQLVIDDVLSKHKVIIILDGLEIPLSPFPPPLVPGAMREFERFGICRWIQSLFLPHLAPSARNRLFLICAARRADTVWLGNLIGHKLGTQIYELRGLEMPDAIDLAQRVLRAHGEKVEQWENEDSDWLESIINLLEGIPLAILHVLPFQTAFNIPWRLFFHRLHAGILSSPGDLLWMNSGDCQDCSFVQEIRHLSSVMVIHDFLFLLLFSNYWHEAPPPAMLRNLFIASVGHCPKDCFPGQENAEEFGPWAASLSGFVADRGYLSTDQHRISMWVHPLLTVCGRAFAFELISCTAREEMKQPLVISIEQLLFVDSVLSSACPSDSQLDAKCEVGTANLITCINLCISEDSAIPLERWPLRLFLTFSLHMDKELHVSPGPLVAEKYCQLLRVFSESFNTSVADEQHIGFFTLALFCLCNGGLNHGFGTWKRCHEMSIWGGSMILALERLSGAEMVAKFAFWKGLLLLAQTFSLSGIQSHEEAARSWQAVKALKYEMSCQPSQELIYPNSEGTTQELKPGTTAFYRIFEQMVEHLQAHESEFLITEQQGSSEPNQQPKETLEFMKMISEYAVDELKEMSACCGRDIEVVLPQKDDVQYQQLAALEETQDTSDWGKVCEHHRILAQEALEGCRFDEADEHIEALRKIFQKSSLYSNALPVVADLEKVALMMRKQFMLVCSCFPSEAGGRQDALQIHEIFTNLVADVLPYSTSLAKTYREHMFKTKESLAYPTHIPRERAVKWLRKYGSRLSQNLTYRTEVMKVFEDYARLASEARDAYKAADFETCLQKLEHLAELERNELPVSDFITESVVTEELRECCTHFIAIRRLSAAWYAAICKNDFGAAQSYAEELAQMEQTATSGMRISADVIDQLRLSTEQQHLQYWMQVLQQARAAEDLVKFSKLYRNLIERWEEGDFPNLDSAQMCLYRSENLEWMIQRAVDDRLWSEGIGFCDEYLAVFALKPQENATARDRCLNTREMCESSLIQQSFGVAEDELDFEKCLQLVDDWEMLWNNQKQTFERPRTSFLLLSKKMLHFLRDCYRDRCIPCARWCRLREKTSCPLDERRGQFRVGKAGRRSRHHNRETMRVPFGCGHHCKGGYCLFD